GSRLRPRTPETTRLWTAHHDATRQRDRHKGVMTADEQIDRGHIPLEMHVAAGVGTMFGAVAGPRPAPERDINEY
ncbi:MAG: hypothetical protein VYD01_02285, partial [Pseudomonadota bacterium]|nr:hypothetical protein [Pseudomonadota bacterium]